MCSLNLIYNINNNKKEFIKILCVIMYMQVMEQNLVKYFMYCIIQKYVDVRGVGVNMDVNKVLLYRIVIVI